MLAIGGRGRADEGNFGSFGQGRADAGNFGRGRAGKRAYVKPLLATHGTVEQMTLGGHKSDPHSPDSGSNIRFKPGPFGGNLFDR